jgi:hypothetical protein
MKAEVAAQKKQIATDRSEVGMKQRRAAHEPGGFFV